MTQTKFSGNIEQTSLRYKSNVLSSSSSIPPMTLCQPFFRLLSPHIFVLPTTDAICIRYTLMSTTGQGIFHREPLSILLKIQFSLTSKGAPWVAVLVEFRFAPLVACVGSFEVDAPVTRPVTPQKSYPYQTTSMRPQTPATAR